MPSSPTLAEKIERLLMAARYLVAEDSAVVVHPGTNDENVRVDFAADAWEDFHLALDGVRGITPADLAALAGSGAPPRLPDGASPPCGLPGHRSCRSWPMPDHPGATVHEHFVAGAPPAAPEAAMARILLAAKSLADVVERHLAFHRERRSEQARDWKQSPFEADAEPVLHELRQAFAAPPPVPAPGVVLSAAECARLVVFHEAIRKLACLEGGAPDDDCGAPECTTYRREAAATEPLLARLRAAAGGAQER